MKQDTEKNNGTDRAHLQLIMAPNKFINVNPNEYNIKYMLPL